MYILECADGSYYTGSTIDLERRIQQHQAGEGANHTKKRLPIKLVYSEEFQRIDKAFNREKQVQGWSRKKKQALIDKKHHQLPDLSKAYRDVASSTSATKSSIPLLEALEGNIPKLRFPEFKNDGEWRERDFYKIGEFIGGGTPSTSEHTYWNGKIQWYTPTEIKNGTLKPSIRTITKLGLQKSSAKLLPEGTILITTRATIGDVAITEQECTTNQGFQSLVVNDTEINVFWLYWIQEFKNELIKRSSGSTFKEIGKAEIKSIPTFSPKKQEQQKIANCLSSLDNLITAGSEKLDHLKDHKKGLLQQLFPTKENTKSQ